MKRSNKIEFVNPNTLKGHPDNPRKTFAAVPLQLLMEDIERTGGITNPLFVEKELMATLQGERRLRCLKELLARKDLPSELRAKLEKTPVVFFTELSEEERLDIMIDEGTKVTLNAVEIVLLIWELMKQGGTWLSIGKRLASRIPTLTGREDKWKEIQAEANVQKKEKLFKSWLRGTVGDQVMAAGRMGELVKEQFLLKYTWKDNGKYTEAEDKRFKFDAKTARISELSRAITADEKSATGWSKDVGGEKFNALITQYIEEDSKPKVRQERAFTPEKMVEHSKALSSNAQTLAYLHCAGKATETQVRELVQIDTELARREKVFSVLTQNVELLERLPGELVRAILYGTPDDVNAQLQKFVVIEAKVA